MGSVDAGIDNGHDHPCTKCPRPGSGCIDVCIGHSSTLPDIVVVPLHGEEGLVLRCLESENVVLPDLHAQLAGQGTDGFSRGPLDRDLDTDPVLALGCLP
jgi:hypothetical protein